MKNKPKDNKRVNVHLSKSDVDAILCALPLIPYLDSGSDMQNKINDSLMVTATEKLMAKNPNLTPNEHRIIYTAVALAVNLETFLGDTPIDPHWRSELKRHFFVLNRIHELTKSQIYK